MESLEKTWLDLTLIEIVEEYKDGSDEALDGDDVDRVTEIIKAKLNLYQGNITEEEYNNILDNKTALQGNFNLENDYEVFGYRFEFWNNDEGFTSISVFDGDDEIDVYNGIEKIYPDDDYETIKRFEDIVQILLKGKK